MLPTWRTPRRNRRLTSRQHWKPVTQTSCAMRLALWPRRAAWAILPRHADLNGESLYKARGEIGNPEFSTVMRVMRALGLTLAARPAEPPPMRVRGRSCLAPRLGIQVNGHLSCRI